MKQIVYVRKMVGNRLLTPDGTILQSRHRHDMASHLDKNGNMYMIDGGCEYIRSSYNGDEVYLTTFSCDPIKEIREVFHWGNNYDKDMNRIPTRWVRLKDITDDHLEAILIYPGVPDWCLEIFEKEKQFRGNQIIGTL